MSKAQADRRSAALLWQDDRSGDVPMIGAVRARPHPAGTPVPDAARFRETCAQLPAGVSVVAGADAAGCYGLTASTVSSLSLSPPLMLVCLDKRATTLHRLLRGSTFGISVLPANASAVADDFAGQRRGADKFAAAAYTLRDGAPVLTDALAWWVCQLTATYPGGDHTILVGGVSAMGHRSGDPLVWHARRYRTLADAPAKDPR